MVTEDTTSFVKKKAQCSMVVWGGTYVFLFPVMFLLFAPFATGSSTDASFREKLIGFITLLPIFAMPISFFLMCFSYSKAYYKVTRLCWMVPIFFFALVLLVHIVLDIVV